MTCYRNYYIGQKTHCFVFIFTNICRILRANRDLPWFYSAKNSDLQSRSRQHFPVIPTGTVLLSRLHSGQTSGSCSTEPSTQNNTYLRLFYFKLCLLSLQAVRSLLLTLIANGVSL